MSKEIEYEYTIFAKGPQSAFDFLEKFEPPLRQDFLEDIARDLAAVRRHKGLTQEKLNDQLGCADRLVNKWECGDKYPSGFNLYCWADALNCDLKVVPRDEC